jgi:hypothetical protein
VWVLPVAEPSAPRIVTVGLEAISFVVVQSVEQKNSTVSN